LCDSEGLPLTQEFLAQVIGARRNAVSIVAHAFRQAGIVNYSRGHIEITDIDGLRKTSCECYWAVQRQRDRLLPARASRLTASRNRGVIDHRIRALRQASDTRC